MQATMQYTRNTILTTIIVSCLGSILSNRRAGGGIIRNLLQSIIIASSGILCFGIMVFIAAILGGASPWVDTLHTFLASLYVASLAFGPSLVFDAEGHVQQSPSPTKLLMRLLCAPHSQLVNCQHIRERIDSLAMYGTFVGLVPCMILRLLDHGDQVQRWPFPVLLGSSIGYFVGSMVGTLSSYMILRHRRSADKM